MPDEKFDCPECKAKESVWILATAGGRGTGESTSYGAKCVSCERWLADEMPSNSDGKKASAVRECKRVLASWPEVRTRRPKSTDVLSAPVPRQKPIRRQTRSPLPVSALPEGYVLVPKVPTEAMLAHGQEAWLTKRSTQPATEDCEEAASVWLAMITAAFQRPDDLV